MIVISVSELNLLITIDICNNIEFPLVCQRELSLAGSVNLKVPVKIRLLVYLHALYGTITLWIIPWLSSLTHQAL